MRNISFIAFGWLLALGAGLVAHDLLQTIGIVCLGFALLLAMQHTGGAE